MKAANLHRFKQMLWKYAPPIFHLARFCRRTMHERRESRIDHVLRPIRAAIAARYGFVVQSGPFCGMKYVEHAFGSPFLPKLIGSYEAEIQPAVEQAMGREYPMVIDIGCDEGYYAVGMLLSSPKSVMYAFDTLPTAQEACKQMAKLNGVADRLVVDGECTLARLRGVLAPGALVICDCEGVEYDLLDPVQVPALRGADLIVELHDHERLDVAITPTLLERFRDSHEITLLDRARRVPSSYPCLAFLTPKEQELATHEGRMPKQQWAVMVARNRGGTLV